VNGLVHRSALSWLKKQKCFARSPALLTQSQTAGQITKPVAASPSRSGFAPPSYENKVIDFVFAFADFVIAASWSIGSAFALRALAALPAL
jgi:hypothetical protein